jgi:hypothetical protein
VLVVVAHVGHWWTTIFYLAPVVVVGVALAISERRARRRNDAGREP